MQKYEAEKIISISFLYKILNFAQKKINNSILEKLKNEKNKTVSLNHLNFILFYKCFLCY